MTVLDRVGVNACNLGENPLRKSQEIMRNLSVAVRSCVVSTPQRRWRQQYDASNTTVDMLAAILHHIMEDRYQGHLQPGESADLEFVPLPCLMEDDQSLRPPPKFGRFAVLSAPWTDFGLAGRMRRVCSHSCNPLLLERLAFLSVEAPSFIPHGYRMEKVRFPPIRPEMPVFQVPYPSASHWDGTRLPPVPPLEARRMLAALMANTRERGTNALIGRSSLREMLRDECAAAPGTCVLAGGVRDGALWREGKRYISTAYAGSRFCLQPSGDTATRKGFWDAIQMGCINVIFFTSAGYNGTDEWFGPVTKWSVLVPTAAVVQKRVLHFLASIPLERVRELHDSVLRARARLQYAINGSPPGGDAADIIMERLAGSFEQHKSRREVERTGKRTCNTIAALCARLYQH